jgi:hypothetical protein
VQADHRVSEPEPLDPKEQRRRHLSEIGRRGGEAVQRNHPGHLQKIAQSGGIARAKQQKPKRKPPATKNNPVTDGIDRILRDLEGKKR